MFSETLYAAETAAQPSLVESLIPFGFVFIIMYFLLFRPSAKKAKEHTQLLSNLKPGDEVVTSGGIIGRVKSVSMDQVVLDAGQTQLRILKEHIVRTLVAESPKK